MRKEVDYLISDAGKLSLPLDLQIAALKNKLIKDFKFKKNKNIRIKLETVSKI